MNGLNGMLETSLIDPRTLEESVSIKVLLLRGSGLRSLGYCPLSGTRNCDRILSTNILEKFGSRGEQGIQEGLGFGSMNLEIPEEG